MTSSAVSYTHLGGKGVQLLFGNKYREDPHRQRNDQHSAEDKDTHIQISDVYKRQV